MLPNFVTPIVMFCMLVAAVWHPINAQDLIELPELTGRVVDQTGTLTASQQQQLAGKLKEFERAEGSQVVVVIIPTTEPEAIEQFTIRLAEAWQIGREDVDDGVILLVAKDDRNLRIEVGYGLEGAIPDAIAKRIIADIIVPHFKQDDYYAGIDAGVDAILARIKGEPLPEASGELSDEGGSAGDGMSTYASGAVVIIGFIVGIFLRATGSMGRQIVGAMIFGAVVFVVAFLVLWLLSQSLYYAFLGFMFAAFAGRGRGGGIGGGGFSSGGGGGFSGGGGSFGGGGASGSW
ncbi:MAG: YgcG family protein [Leptospiraceae bacterium]|nr:YgcG family protein [Leptospiraceae bacterium]